MERAAVRAKGRRAESILGGVGGERRRDGDGEFRSLLPPTSSHILPLELQTFGTTGQRKRASPLELPASASRSYPSRRSLVFFEPLSACLALLVQLVITEDHTKQVISTNRTCMYCPGGHLSLTGALEEPEDKAASLASMTACAVAFRSGQRSKA